VLHTAAGARYLKVCFSTPSLPGEESQPMIAADGRASHFTYGCEESTPLAELPKVSGEGPPGGETVTFSNTVVLPNVATCVRQTSLKITLNDPKYDPLKNVVVTINGKTAARVRGVKSVKKGVTLKRLPSGTYKIGIVATTVLNQRLSGSKTYHSCTKSSGKIKLHRVVKASHHHHG
jgi:hypothetical protein